MRSQNEEKHSQIHGPSHFVTSLHLNIQLWWILHVVKSLLISITLRSIFYLISGRQQKCLFGTDEGASLFPSMNATVFLVPLCPRLPPSYPGGPDHGQHGAPPPGASSGRLPEPHHPAGHPAHAPWLPARLCARAQRQHWIAAAAQLVCPNR